MRRGNLHRFIAAPVAVVLFAACGAGRETAPAASAEGRQPSSELVQRMTGLSHLPRVESPEALSRSMARHYPREFIGIRPKTLVLVDVRVDEKGRVLEVTPVNRPANASENVKMVLVDEVPGSNTPVARSYEAAYDQAFGPAASAALRDVRFQPALRDGRPVPYTLRMTVEFKSPEQAS